MTTEMMGLGYMHKRVTDILYTGEGGREDEEGGIERGRGI